jgi:hypothetical protein
MKDKTFAKGGTTGAMMNGRKDDLPTIVSLAVLAYVVQDVLHEGLGHGVVAWFSGARRLTISTVALQSDISSRWIEAAGTLVNLAFAGIFWLLLLKPQRYKPVTRYFLILLIAGNLFSGTGYFLFSGIMNFGDWAQVIKDLPHHGLLRAGLIMVGVVSYYLSMLVVASQLRAFLPDEAASRRVRTLAWTPYVAEGALAGLAGILNPAGLFYVIASALPSTLGANAGMLSLPSLMRGWKRNQPEPVPPIPRSRGWIAAAIAVGLFFVVVLGRGVTLTP